MGKAGLFGISDRNKPSTPADTLRLKLERLEQAVGSLRYADPTTALEIPVQFDTAHALLRDLRDRGVDVVAEQTRFDSIAAQYRHQAALFLKLIGGAPVLQRRREEIRPDDSAWWWTADLWLKDQQRDVRLRRLRWAIAVLVVLSGLGLAYSRFLAPDQTTRAIYNHQLNAIEMAARGDTLSALEETETGLALDPDHPELLTLRGVLLEVLGEPSAEAALSLAEAASGDREEFLVIRGQFQVQLGQFEGLMETAEDLLAVNEQSAVAYLYRGMAAEGLGDSHEARLSYERAGELAREQGLHEVYVISRSLLANLPASVVP